MSHDKNEFIYSKIIGGYMGFNLEAMFEELIAVLNSEKKDSKKIKELTEKIHSAKKYAEECGQLR